MSVVGVAVLLPSVALAGSAGLPGARSAQAHAAKHKHKHKKHHHTTTGGGGPSMTVLGFGINHLYVANGTTVTNSADCSTMVQGNGYLDGPPQDVYLNGYLKATDIPASAPTQVAEDYPGADEAPLIRVREATLSAPVPWSQAFSPSTLGFGEPPGSQKDIFRAGFFGTSDPNGPSASDFNGDYSFEVSVDVNGTTLDSTATATVDCPYG